MQGPEQRREYLQKSMGEVLSKGRLLVAMKLTWPMK